MVAMTAVLVVVVPLVLAVFAGQMERLESAVLPTPATGPASPRVVEDPAAEAADRGTDIRADVHPLELSAEEVTPTR